MRQDGEKLILEPEEAAASGFELTMPLTSAARMYAEAQTKALAVSAVADELSMSPVRGDKDRMRQLREQSQILGSLSLQLGTLIDPQGMREAAIIEAFNQSLREL